jgi:hypothetical protein
MLDALDFNRGPHLHRPASGKAKIILGNNPGGTTRGREQPGDRRDVSPRLRSIGIVNVPSVSGFCRITGVRLEVE